MITISVCMIVKNEERILARCLDSLAGIADEIIIVDTGSTDRTKEIAAAYTDKIYDFEWCFDFAAARNYSFSKAGCDYIYSADADELLDERNRQAFLRLKTILTDDVDIVQMNYITPEKYNTVENFSRDLRPKLYRRLRPFRWVNPVHETVQLVPTVYDSDIEILHLPENLHSGRDFGLFQNAIERYGTLAPETITMYAKELLRCGTDQDFLKAYSFFNKIYEENITDESTVIIARCARLSDDPDTFFSVALKNVAMGGCSEIMCELGFYYLIKEKYEESALWFYNAAFETEPVLNIDSHGIIPYSALVRCYDALAEQTGDDAFAEKRDEYSKMAAEWQRP